VSCICEKGYTGSPANCTACPVGRYKNQTGSANCTACPLLTSTLSTNATKYEDCLCIKGYNGPPNSNNKSVTCKPCPIGTYKDFLGKIGDGEALTLCLACPEHSYSGFASDDRADCVCNAGFQPDADGACTSCAAGKYKPQRLYKPQGNGSLPKGVNASNFTGVNSSNVNYILNVPTRMDTARLHPKCAPRSVTKDFAVPVLRALRAQPARVILSQLQEAMQALIAIALQGITG
jgi:hypothetical protein